MQHMQGRSLCQPEFNQFHLPRHSSAQIETTVTFVFIKNLFPLTYHFIIFFLTEEKKMQFCCCCSFCYRQLTLLTLPNYLCLCGSCFLLVCVQCDRRPIQSQQLALENTIAVMQTTSPSKLMRKSEIGIKKSTHFEVVFDVQSIPNDKIGRIVFYQAFPFFNGSS